jgi:hypothetical protein
VIPRRDIKGDVLMSSIINDGRTQPRKLTTARGLSERYGVTDRTLSRWVETGVMPAPVYIQRRRYWDLAAIETADEARATKWEGPPPGRSSEESGEPVSETAA